MYMTIDETAEYLDLPVNKIETLILQRRIRFIHDGAQYLIYKEQFQTHFEQLENYKSAQAEYYNQPIPEDIDVKDED
ncbi:excisionase family DNA-binding protein [Sediminibacillus massiliensis]|uniref:excisionase family DNA-binding protein n=1 Tax=Sediminibacillus massiliensis TaxID=1926277 RepID=UPI000988781D|nr:excisionase family DNA-binding protein [Sediminibacillus massiliensis]